MALFKPPVGAISIDNATTLNGKSESNLSVANADKLDNLDASDFATSEHLHTDVYEPIISPKNSAFNVNFGTDHTDVAYGDHTHNNTDISVINTTPVDVFTKTLTGSSDNYGSTDLEMRCVIPAADIIGTGNVITISLTASSSSTLIFTSVYIVERDGDTPNGITLPTQVTFSNYMNLNRIVISANTTATSDLIEFDIDDTKDYLLIMSNHGLYSPMRAEGLTYYSTTTVDPDAKDMADPNPQTTSYIFCVASINAYTRHKLEFKSNSLYEIGETLTINGDPLLTDNFDSTTSTTFRIASGEGIYAPQFAFSKSPWTLKLLNANNFKLDGDNNNTNTYNLYTGSSCVNISAITSNASDRFMLDEYLGNGYAYWDYAIANNGTRSFEEWNTNNIEYDKHCSGNIIYDIYTTGGASNRGLKLNFTTTLEPLAKLYVSETIYSSVDPTEIKIISDESIWNSATLRVKTSTFGGDNVYAGLYLASGANNGINIVTKDVNDPLIEIFNSSEQLTLKPSSITIRDGSVPVYRGSSATHPSNPIASDEYWNTKYSKYFKYNGTDWTTVENDSHAHQIVSVLEKVIDGNGSAITSGSKGYCVVPYDCTIRGNFIIADQSGDIVVDIKKSTYANFPTTTSITASAKPTLSAAQKSTDDTLTGWTTSASTGDILEFVVDSAATVTRVNIALIISGISGEVI